MPHKLEIGPWSIQLLAQSAVVSLEDLIKGASACTLDSIAVTPSEGRRLETLRSRWLLRARCGLTSDPAKSDDGDLIWPTGICGSMTHKRGHVAAVVADANQWASVGLDLESRAISEKIGPKVLIAEEFARLQDVGDLGTQIAAGFAAKEAIFKAVFPIGRQKFWFHDAVIRRVHENISDQSLQFIADVGAAAGGPAEWNRQCEISLRTVNLDQKKYWLAVCGLPLVAHDSRAASTIG